MLWGHPKPKTLGNCEWIKSGTQKETGHNKHIEITTIRQEKQNQITRYAMQRFLGHSGKPMVGNLPAPFMKGKGKRKSDASLDFAKASASKKRLQPQHAKCQGWPVFVAFRAVHYSAEAFPFASSKTLLVVFPPSIFQICLEIVASHIPWFVCLFWPGFFQTCVLAFGFDFCTGFGRGQFSRVFGLAKGWWWNLLPWAMRHETSSMHQASFIKNPKLIIN